MVSCKIDNPKIIDLENQLKELTSQIFVDKRREQAERIFNNCNNEKDKLGFERNYMMDLEYNIRNYTVIKNNKNFSNIHY